MYRVGERAPRGEGRLYVTVHPSGLKEFYYRIRTDRLDRSVRIGRFEQTPGQGGMSLEEARKELGRLVALQRGTGDVKAELFRQEREAEATRREVERQARLGTLEQVLDCYVADLRARGCVSARAVETTFKRWVKKPFPDLCQSLAKTVTSKDIQKVLANLVNRGLRRGVNLLRSYLHAAFQKAAESDNDPEQLAHNGPIFEIVSNPVAIIPRKAKFERVGDRHLSEAELGRYWHAIDTLELPAARDFLRLDLAMAGQRIVQFLRAKWSDFDFGARTLLLRDPKGGRGALPRDHLLPLSDLALELLAPLQAAHADADGPFISRATWSLHPATVSKSIKAVWETLAAEDKREGRSPIAEFNHRDLRRTCETQLASLRVSKEIRAHLLSHGRTGVQDKHYDRYTYLPEKRAALVKWAKHLRRIASKNDGSTTANSRRSAAATINVDGSGGRQSPRAPSSA